MKHLLLLNVLVIAISASRSDGGAPKVGRPAASSKSGVATAPHAGAVSIDAGDLFIEGPWRPSSLLSEALTKYPKAHKFIVSWNSDASGGGDSCLAHYDRAKHLFELWHWTSYAYDDDKTGIETDHYWKKVWKYTRVTDTILKKLAKKNANNYDGDDAEVGYFTELPKFGGKGRKVKDSRRIIHKKIPR